MGRLTYMQKSYWLAALTAAVLLISGCSIESPVSATNRPLAEQLADRQAEADAEPEATPDAIALVDTWESGTFLRLDVSENAAEVVLRSGPGPDFPEVAVVESGGEVLATGNQTGQWVHVLFAAFDGWVHSDNVVESFDRAPVDIAELEEQDPIYVVANSGGAGVNVRTGPAVGFELVTWASNGDELTGTGNTEGGWIEVRVDGLTGWSSGRLLQAVGGTPAAAPAPIADSDE